MRHCSLSDEMPCVSCEVNFSVFRRRRLCPECDRPFCANCLRRGAGLCGACRTLTTRPLIRETILQLKARELQSFLQRQNVSTRGCIEKEELINLCISHVNSGAYRRQGQKTSRTFSTLKVMKDNINQFINSAIEMRTGPSKPPSTRETHGNCYNASHSHAAPQERVSPDATQERVPPPGAREHVPPTAPRPPPPTAPSTSQEPSGESSPGSGEGAPRVDTADCFEMEDVADAGWEFVHRPAESLPNDSEVLLEQRSASPPSPPRVARTPSRPESLLLPEPARRTVSELELRTPDASAAAVAAADDRADSTSLQDEPYAQMEPEPAPPPLARQENRCRLSELSSEDELRSLSAKQLKYLLEWNRVELRGCLERDDLLAKAVELYQDHVKYKDVIETLPNEDICKICMSAPLECALLNCGHMATCADCSRVLAECPICRRYVSRVVRVYRS